MAKSNGEMLIERFEELLDLYGPDMKTWPQEEIAAAKELMSKSELARTKYQFVLSIAKLADNAPRPKAPASLVDRIMGKIKK
nr:hypothetical protein [uncultured Cohaesibacter sp.]